MSLQIFPSHKQSMDTYKVYFERAVFTRIVVIEVVSRKSTAIMCCFKFEIIGCTGSHHIPDVLEGVS